MRIHIDIDRPHVDYMHYVPVSMVECRHVLCPSEHDRMQRAAEGELKLYQTGNGGKVTGKGRN